MISCFPPNAHHSRVIQSRRWPWGGPIDVERHQMVLRAGCNPQETAIGLLLRNLKSFASIVVVVVVVAANTLGSTLIHSAVKMCVGEGWGGMGGTTTKHSPFTMAVWPQRFFLSCTHSVHTWVTHYKLGTCIPLEVWMKTDRSTGSTAESQPTETRNKSPTPPRNTHTPLPTCVCRCVWSRKGRCCVSVSAHKRIKHLLRWMCGSCARARDNTARLSVFW